MPAYRFVLPMSLRCRFCVCNAACQRRPWQPTQRKPKGAGRSLSIVQHAALRLPKIRRAQKASLAQVGETAQLIHQMLLLLLLLLLQLLRPLWRWRSPLLPPHLRQAPCLEPLLGDSANTGSAFGRQFSQRAERDTR